MQRPERAARCWEGHVDRPTVNGDDDHVRPRAVEEETSGTSLPLDQLSPAERRVFELALDGRSTAGIAEALVLSEATVRSHLTRIYAKLQVHGRLDLLARVGASESTGQPIDASTSQPAVSARALPWVAGGLSVVGLSVAIFAPPVTFLLGPLAVGFGLTLGRRLPADRRWMRRVVLAVGVILCLEALLIALFVFGLLALGTRAGGP